MSLWLIWKDRRFYPAVDHVVATVGSEHAARVDCELPVYFVTFCLAAVLFTSVRPVFLSVFFLTSFLVFCFFSVFFLPVVITFLPSFCVRLPVCVVLSLFVSFFFVFSFCFVLFSSIALVGPRKLTSRQIPVTYLHFHRLIFFFLCLAFFLFLLAFLFQRLFPIPKYLKNSSQSFLFRTVLAP